MSTLLEVAGVPINPRYPSKTKDRLEKALDTLREDEVIAGWHYEQWEEDTLNHNGWAPLWEQVTVLIEPPLVIREAYKSIEQHEDNHTGITGNQIELT